MKIIIYILTFLSFGIFGAQKKQYWLIDSQTNAKTIVNDSLQAVQYLDSLAQNYYYFTTVEQVIENGDNIEIYFNKGKNYNQAKVEITPEIATKLNLNSSFFTKNLDSLKHKISDTYTKDGFIFNRVKTEFLGFRDELPQVRLAIIKGDQRKIDKINIQGYDKIPIRFKKNLEREYLNKPYQEKQLSTLSRALQNHPYFILQKAPQTMFTKDSTQVYLTLAKKKSNSFDGIIGFGNDKSEKFTFNGSLNLNFQNVFNSFESINLYWQRNPDKGQTFDIQTDIPYLLRSNIGGNFKLNIFRQDSTYATVKFTPALYLHLLKNQKIGARGTFETSTVIDSLYVQGKDYTKKGLGLWYQYSEPTDVELFRFRTQINAGADYIRTHYPKNDEQTAQMHYYISGERNFQLTGNHYINAKLESAMLNSNADLVTNELLRFGGWDSFRGFNEKSLLTNFYYYGTAEYRYLIGNQAFFDTFLQYGQFHNKNLQFHPKIYSVGVGFNFILPIGLMSFQISNGSEFGNPFQFKDTKIHWGILSRF